MAAISGRSSCVSQIGHTQEGLIRPEFGLEFWNACSEGNARTMRQLIEEYIDAHRPLCSDTEQNEVDVQFCVRNYPQEQAHCSLLEVAAGFGRLEICKELVGAYGAQVDPEGSMFSALYRACQYGHEEVVEFLVEAGADLYFDPNIAGESKTPIEVAIKWRRKGCVLTLITKGGMGVDGNEIEGLRKSHLQQAILLKAHGVAQVLMSQGADVNYQGANGLTVFNDAWDQTGDAEMATELLKAGARVDPNLIAKHFLTIGPPCTRTPTEEMMRLIIVENRQYPTNLETLKVAENKKPDFDERFSLVQGWLDGIKADWFALMTTLQNDTGE